MIKKTQKMLVLTVFSCLLSTPSYAIRYADICDGADRVLYGHKEISAPFLMRIIEKIDEPETDRRRHGIKVREKEESEEVVKNSKKALSEKVNNFKDDESNEVVRSINKRVRELLEFDLSSFDPVPLSYLLEKINNEY